MPTIHIYHPEAMPAAGGDVSAVLQSTCAAVSASAGLPADKVWAFWHVTPLAQSCRTDWRADTVQGPLVRMFCKRSHSPERVQRIMRCLRDSLAGSLGCAPGKVFVQVIRVDDEEVLNVE